MRFSIFMFATTAIGFFLSGLLMGIPLKRQRARYDGLLSLIGGCVGLGVLVFLSPNVEALVPLKEKVGRTVLFLPPVLLLAGLWAGFLLGQRQMRSGAART